MIGQKFMIERIFIILSILYVYLEILIIFFISALFKNNISNILLITTRLNFKQANQRMLGWPSGLRRQTQAYSLPLMVSAFWSSIEGVGSNPTSDKYFFLLIHLRNFIMDPRLSFDNIFHI